MAEGVVTAAVLIIGNEILSGRTKDANLSFLGARLNDLGIRLLEARVVADVEARIVEALNALRADHDYVFTTGGIGPTHDDITAESVAKAFGLPIGVDPRARAILESFYPTGQLNERRLRMARLPEGARLIENPVSGAPGFQVENVFVMAGIPAIAQAMFEGLRDRLVGGAPLLSHALSLFTPESVLAPGFEALQARFPDVEMGSYPFNRDGRFGSTLVLRCSDRGRLAEAAEGLRALAGELDAETADERGALVQDEA